MKQLFPLLDLLLSKKKLLLITIEIIFISFIKLTSTLKIINGKREDLKMNIYIIFEYPYSCGTWYNRGKEVCNEIQHRIENNGLNVIPSIKAFHMGDFPQDYNGFFNVYLNNNGNKILLGTSDENSQLFHKGLKSFAYTYYSTDDKTGERNYLNINPEIADLINFIFKKLQSSLKNIDLNQKNYYYD
jgi:hypothetical protein